MGSYVPSTQAQREQMLRAVGLENVMDLYRDVPEQMLLTEPLHIPAGMSELEVSRAAAAAAEAEAEKIDDDIADEAEKLVE